MNPGEFNKKISIQKVDLVTDNEGIQNKQWLTIRTCWAKSEDKILKSINENNQTSSVVETNFIIRKNNEFYNNKNRVVHNDIVYKIVDVMEQGNYLKIITEGKSNGE